MAGAFDPYHKWLGIAPDERPPSHYRLLGLRPFESDSDAISAAADQRAAHLRTFQNGPHSTESQTLLNAVSAARMCLLNPAKKAAYDATLRQVVPPTVKPPSTAHRASAWSNPDEPARATPPLPPPGPCAVDQRRGVWISQRIAIIAAAAVGVLAICLAVAAALRGTRDEDAKTADAAEMVEVPVVDEVTGLADVAELPAPAMITGRTTLVAIRGFRLRPATPQIRLPVHVPAHEGTATLEVGVWHMYDDDADHGMYCELYDANDQRVFREFSKARAVQWFKATVRGNTDWVVVLEDFDTHAKGKQAGNVGRVEVVVSPAQP